MSAIRSIQSIIKGEPVTEGAGVKLRRVFGYYDAPLFDPFLLLDDFHSDNPQDYVRGFPWHPHRGIETVTYILHGRVEHGDSIGNIGEIGPGDVQWMTAGSGIVHQEMPKETPEKLNWGFQLWVNLPQSRKMTEPRYRDIKQEQIPSVTLDNGVMLKVISGEFEGVNGPVEDIIINPVFADVTVPPETVYSFSVSRDHTVLAYIIEGSGFGDPERNYPDEAETLIFYGPGDTVTVTSGDNGIRFLLISGKPLNEPVAWRGPIVMNTENELDIAFEEYRNGTFLKHSDK